MDLALEIHSYLGSKPKLGYNQGRKDKLSAFDVDQHVLKKIFFYHIAYQSELEVDIGAHIKVGVEGLSIIFKFENSGVQHSVASS